jgi:DNA-binding protein HU-beta
MRFLVPKNFFAKSHHTVGAAIVSFRSRRNFSDRRFDKPAYPLYHLQFRVHKSSASWHHPEPQLIKLDLINEVVNKTGITKAKAEQAVETVFESMKRALSSGDRIELRGFGVFNVRPRKTGIGRNPRTGAQVNIPPGKAVRFKPGKEMLIVE